MAKGRKAAPWLGFVDVQVTEEMVADLSPVGEAEWDVLSESISVWVDTGYAYSVRFSEDFDSYEAGMMGFSSECVNIGYKVTAKAPSLPAAIELLLMKLHRLGSGSWEPFISSAKSSEYR